MTERRMNKLLCELNLPENSVYIPDTDKILKGVKSKIEKQEKQLIWGIRLSKAMVIAAIVILMLALTTVAFGQNGVFKKIFTIFEEPVTESVFPDSGNESYEPPEEIVVIPTEEETEILVNPNYESPIFEKYHKEEPEKAKEYLQNIYASIEDDNYILMLNEIMGDSKNLYITVTVEAKNNTANDLLSDETYGWFRVEAYSGDDGWLRVGGGTDELINLRRENSRSYTMHIFGDDHLENGYSEMRITCRAFSPDMTSERYIYFEVKKKEDVIEFDLAGQPFTGGSVYITPLSIEITIPKEATADYAPDARNLNTFFKFKNGTIKTFNQVAGFDYTTSYVGGDKLYKFSAGTKNVLDIDRLESVIVKGIEYPVSNPNNYTDAYIPENLKPFVLSEGMRQDEMYYPCSIQLLSPCLTITYQEFGIVEFTYAGKKYRAEADNLAVLINDSSEYTLYFAPYADEDGDLWVGMDFLSYLLGIRRDEIGQTGTYLMVP